MLRFSNVLGPDISTPLSKALELPLTPSLMGFDPRVQLVHETDVIRAITHVLDNGVEGIYNVAGDGLVPWSEVAAICGKRTFPLPPYGIDRKSTRLTPVTNAHLVCRLLLEKKKHTQLKPSDKT